VSSALSLNESHRIVEADLRANTVTIQFDGHALCVDVQNMPVELALPVGSLFQFLGTLEAADEQVRNGINQIAYRTNSNTLAQPDRSFDWPKQLDSEGADCAVCGRAGCGAVPPGP
jgi:hypothetical protein